MKKVSNFISMIFRIPIFLIFLVLSSLYFIYVWEQYDVQKYEHLPDHNEEFVKKAHRGISKKKVVLFTVCTVSLSETTRVVNIFKEFESNHKKEIEAGEIEIHFAHYGGKGTFDYTSVIENSELVDPSRIHRLQPEFPSVEEIERFYKIDKGEDFGDFFSYETLSERVKNELSLFEQIKPDIVVSGFVLSSRLSCQIADIPFFLAVPLMYINTNFYIDQLPYFQQETKDIIKKFVPFNLINKVFASLFQLVWYQTTNFKKVALDYGVKPKHRSLFSLMEADITFITDIPDIVGIPETTLHSWYDSSYKYCGYLYAKMDFSDTKELEERIQKSQEEKKKVIYFAMGSSGNTQVVKSILTSLNETLYNDSAFENEIGIIASPTKRLICKFDEKEGLEFIKYLHPKIYVSDILNAPKIAKKADFGITHGGQGTVCTNLVSGLPFVGIPAQIEQEMNIKSAESLGTAIFIDRWEVRQKGAKVVVDTLKRMMENEEYVEKAKEVQKIVEPYNAAKVISREIAKAIQ